MSIDPIREYSNAKTEQAKAQKVVQDMTFVIDKVATALRCNPSAFTIANVRIGSPAEVIPSALESLNANDWPTAEQIAESLKAMHDAHHKAQTLWASLTDSDKENLLPPDSMR